MNPLSTIKVKLTLAGHDIEGSFQLPAHPSPKRVVLPVLRNLTQAATDVARSTGTDFSCAKGCDACCRQMVPLAPTEAHALEEAFDSLDAATAQRVLLRFDRVLTKLNRAGITDRLRRLADLTPPELEQLDRDYFAAQTPCPFLERRACLIHAHRPLACREFLVTSAPAHCAAPGSGHVERVALAATPSVALRESDGAAWVPLILAREFTARHPEPCVNPAETLLDILNRL
jgi:Fe-S-cluster containining protein